MSLAKKCPMCAEEISLAAATCEYCGTQFAITSTGYCQTCHALRAADEKGQCSLCHSPVIDLQIESKFIEQATPEKPPSETRKTNKSALATRAGLVILACTVLVAVIWFGLSNPAAVPGLVAKPTLSATLTLTASATQTQTPTPSPTQTPTITPTITTTTAPPYDNFNGTVLDRKKWAVVLDWKEGGNPGDRIRQNEKLIVLTSNKKPDSGTYVKSTWGLNGDFDIQVDFQKGGNWERPSNGHLDAAILGVMIEKYSYHITRLVNSRSESTIANLFMIWNDKNLYPHSQIYSTAEAGKYRLIRIGTSLKFLCDLGGGWKELGSFTVPSSFARVYLGNASIYASQSFTTYFDNFVINLGTPTSR